MSIEAHKLGIRDNLSQELLICGKEHFIYLDKCLSITIYIEIKIEMQNYIEKWGIVPVM